MNARTKKMVRIGSLLILAVITSLHLLFIYLGRDSFSPFLLIILTVPALVVFRFFYKAFKAELSSEETG